MDHYDISLALKAPFQDPNWLSKTLLGLVWGVLGITAPAIYGAQLAYIRSVQTGDQRLPDWDDFGTKWIEGFLLGLALLIYTMPLWVIGMIVFAPGLVAAISGGGQDVMGLLVGGGSCLFVIFSVVYGLAISYVASAAMTHYAMCRTFGSLFEFREILGRVRGNTNYFGAWVWLIVVSMIVSTASGMISGVTGGLGFIVVPAVSYLGAMASGHLLGQWARTAYASPAPGVI